MVAYEAEQRVRLPALRAGWLTQTFVHRSFPPETIQALMPEQQVVDEYEDAARVGLTPFVVADVRLPGVRAAVPGLPAFAESSLRTYVRHPDGRDGLWFLSLEVACPLMPAARGIGAPYHPGLLEVSEAWPSAAATVEALEETLTASAGLPAPSGGRVVHFSEGIGHVRLGASRPCAPTAASA
ncbi:DUF2071 domain-containing protein [Streptomyces sp. NRRL S-813]|uniref:DUF2071 domain-containing protein n=1 Tax=Streptomyces sp. NRRL S-813 TaxID=1463919 RepID=UPI0007C85EDD|nr:DUF2071 domain-containing protein [Streptomyces sp. NRRL S-813]